MPAAFPDDVWAGTVETVAVSPRQVAGQGKTYPVKIRLQPGENAQVPHRHELPRRNRHAPGRQPPRRWRCRCRPCATKKPPTPTQVAKASVFIVKDGRVTEKNVETGTADDAWIAIKKGVEEEQEIVVGSGARAALPARTVIASRG